RGSNGDFISLKKMLRSIETILMVFSIIVVFLTYISRFWVAANWLTVEDLSLEVVAISIVYMVLINSFRWLTFVYKSGISGMEDQIWLNASNVAFSTVKFIGVLIVFVLVDATPLVFFKYQLLVGILEFI